MPRTKPGEAISKKGRSAESVRRLRGFIKKRNAEKRLDEWKRGRAILGYIEGRPVIQMAAELDVTRGAINRWLQWYKAAGLSGLETRHAPGRSPRLTESQRGELAQIIEDGPLASGYGMGVWTGPMIGGLIAEKFGVQYHNHHVPRLLHDMGFSLQRPRKRLAKADAKRQKEWIQARFPAIKKKARRVRGVVMFGDEASFWLDGSLHRTWARVGHQPQVDTYGQRKTAHVFGALSLEAKPSFQYAMASKLTGKSFLLFLRKLVSYSRRRIFLIIDNGPCHNLDAGGKIWLKENRHRIELHRLPPYSPNFNAIEGAWKETKKQTTHNRFFRTAEERDAALVATFELFQSKPSMLSGLTARFL